MEQTRPDVSRRTFGAHCVYCRRHLLGSRSSYLRIRIWARRAGNFRCRHRYGRRCGAVYYPGGANQGVRLLNWDTALNLPWGVLLLFGGGLALSAQFSDSGLSEWLGEQVEGLAGVSVWVLV